MKMQFLILLLIITGQFLSAQTRLAPSKDTIALNQNKLKDTLTTANQKA
jgi:hypothetical protein